MPGRPWLHIDIDRTSDGLQARGRGSLSENPNPHDLPGITVEDLKSFGEQVRRAAEKGQPINEDVLRQAHVLYSALFQSNLEIVRQRQQGVHPNEPILMRLELGSDRLLQATPWEALCMPETNLGFLGNSTDELIVRGVTSNERADFREVRGPVRVLGVSLVGHATVTRLEAALEKSIQAGEVQFDSLVGLRARHSALIDRLARTPSPHIIHFVCHGRVENGRPQLEMLDDMGKPMWLDVESLAQDLRRHCREHLRLIVLDACEGALPGGLLSAAEWLAQKAATAVVAHLWPIKGDITQFCSESFYRALTRASSRSGDVALSLNEARQEVLKRFRSAEAFSPVLYLRGNDSTLFNFQYRDVIPPPRGMPTGAASAPPAAIYTFLKKPFTLVLGDRWSHEREALNRFRKHLLKALDGSTVGPIPPEISMSALTQHYALRFQEQNLDLAFQQVFANAGAPMPGMDELARRLKPGVHITLLRFPLLELALAEHQPDVTIHVINPPGRDGSLATLRRREAGASDWENVVTPPRSLNPDRDLIVLRLYCGYLPPRIYQRPLLTEDDYLLGVRELEGMLLGPSGNNMFSPDLVDELVAILSHRPALILGMSLLTWHHRMLLYRLFSGGPLPKGSLVVLEPGEPERPLWERGRILFSKGQAQVVELSPSQLAVPLGADLRVDGP